MIEEIIKFQTKDKLELAGILFRPTKATKKVLIYLHGTGGSDIFKKKDFFAEFAKELAKKKTGLLVFNNRGAHIVGKSTYRKGKTVKRFKTGSAFEIIKECTFDIDGAVKFLKEKKFNQFFLAGHSTGANKVCIYDDKIKKNDISKYILFAPGDDTGLLYEELGEKSFTKALKLSLKKVEAGRGDETMSIEGFYLPIISYKSFLDVANPDGEYNTFPFFEIINKVELSKEKKFFKEYQKMSKPTLVILGDKDEYCFGRFPEITVILKHYGNENHEFEFTKGADHGFKGKEKSLFKKISSWL
jgi:dienelactone hydrolase